MRARCGGSTRWSAPPPRWDSTVARHSKCYLFRNHGKLSAPRPFRVWSSSEPVSGQRGGWSGSEAPIWQPEPDDASRAYRASPWRPRSRPTRSWLRCSVQAWTTYGVWNIRLRLPRWCGWRRRPPARAAAAGGGGGRGGGGGGARRPVVCWSSTASVTLGPTWRASSSTASSSCSSSGRTSTGWAASPPGCRALASRTGLCPGTPARTRRARASCRRRRPPTVRRPSSSCARRSAGQRGCTHDLTTARSRPARASAIFYDARGGRTRMPTPRGTASRRMRQHSSGRLRCSPFVTRSSGRCSRFTPSCRAARSSSTRSWLRTRSRRSPKRAPSSCSVGGSRRAARWQRPAATSCATR